MNKKLIRIGDIVRVVNPQFFIKARYEKDFQFFYDKVILNRDKEIEQMISIICPNWETTINTRSVSNLREQIVRGIASYDLEQSKATGNVRYLEVTPIVWYKYKKFLVHDVFRISTGIYQAGASGQDSNTGEYWGEPPGLVNRKYHRILKVVAFDEDIVYNIPSMDIEDCNVEFIEKKTVNTPIPKQVSYCPVDVEEFELIGIDEGQEYINEMYMQQPVKPYYKEP